MAFIVIRYVFTSIALMTMLKKCGHKSPFLAWVPFASLYVYGELADKYDNNKPPKKTGRSLLIFNIILLANSYVFLFILCFSLFLRLSYFEIGLIAILGYISTIVLTVIYSIKIILATWKILKIFAPSSSVGLLVLYIFVGVARPFILFAIRNNEPKNLRGQKEEGFTVPIFYPYMYPPYNQMGMQYPNNPQQPYNNPYNNQYVMPPQDNNQNNNQ
jgi:hypothetical protein